MFDLTEDYLKDQNILDCAVGASSFTAQSLNRGYEAVGMDILYDLEPDDLEKICIDDFNTFLETHSARDDDSTILI